MTLLSGTVQPPLLTLLSSTSQPSLSPLFRTVTDEQHPKDAFVATAQDDKPSSSRDGSYIPRSPAHTRASHVLGPVIHIQSPDPRKTYVQAGDRKGKGRATPHDDKHQPLGIELPWVGMQMKRLGQRGMSVEFGVVDERGVEGVVRLSSYKTEPSVHPDRTPPLIHLPLKLPAIDQHTLTDWLDVTLNLASLIPLFKSLPRDQAAQEADEALKRRKNEVPSDRFAYVSYVRVYANCRIRRIWFSQDGPRTLEQAGVTDEWALYAAKNDVP